VPTGTSGVLEECNLISADRHIRRVGRADVFEIEADLSALIVCSFFIGLSITTFSCFAYNKLEHEEAVIVWQFL